MLSLSTSSAAKILPRMDSGPDLAFIARQHNTASCGMRRMSAWDIIGIPVLFESGLGDAAFVHVLGVLSLVASDDVVDSESRSGQSMAAGTLSW